MAFGHENLIAGRVNWQYMQLQSEAARGESLPRGANPDLRERLRIRQEQRIIMPMCPRCRNHGNSQQGVASFAPVIPAKEGIQSSFRHTTLQMRSGFPGEPSRCLVFTLLETVVVVPAIMLARYCPVSRADVVAQFQLVAKQ